MACVSRRSGRRWMVLAGGVILAAVLAAGCGEPDQRGPTGPDVKAAPAKETASKVAPSPGARSASRPAPTDLLPARFHAVMYEVRLPADRAGRLDAAALAAKADKPESLQAALAELGKTQVLYQVDQTVNLCSDSITISNRVPSVTASRVMEGGRVVNTVQYQQVGVIFNLSGGPAKDPKRKGLDVQLKVELSLLTDTATEISSGVKATSVRSVQMGYSGPPDFGRPIILFGVDSASKDASGNAVACVCRCVFSEVNP